MPLMFRAWIHIIFCSLMLQESRRNWSCSRIWISSTKKEAEKRLKPSQLNSAIKATYFSSRSWHSRSQSFRQRTSTYGVSRRRPLPGKSPRTQWSSSLWARVYSNRQESWCPLCCRSGQTHSRGLSVSRWWPGF